MPSITLIILSVIAGLVLMMSVKYIVKDPANWIAGGIFGFLVMLLTLSLPSYYHGAMNSAFAKGLVITLIVFVVGLCFGDIDD